MHEQSATDLEDERLVTYEGITHKGGREKNEDSIAVRCVEDSCCFVLCDGLGGHGSGEVASSLTCQVFTDLFAQTPNPQPQAFFESAIRTANETILERQKADGLVGGMKTTLVSLLMVGDSCTWVHVGDSRLYLFRDGAVVCRTMDHSVPQMLVNTGAIQEEEIRFHPDRNRLLRALGSDAENLRFDISEPVPMQDCQAFLLCTDGFWEYIDEEQMCAALNESADATEWLQRMKAIVQANGDKEKMDNFSAIAVYIGE